MYTVHFSGSNSAMRRSYDDWKWPAMCSQFVVWTSNVNRYCGQTLRIDTADRYCGQALQALDRAYSERFSFTLLVRSLFRLAGCPIKQVN